MTYLNFLHHPFLSGNGAAVILNMESKVNFRDYMLVLDLFDTSDGLFLALGEGGHRRRRVTLP